MKNTISIIDFLKEEELKRVKLLEEKKTIYIDMDNVLVDFRSAFKHFEESYLNRIEDKDEIEGIFSKMEPMKNAIASVEFLAKYFNVYILSTSPWNNPSAWSDKLNWIKKYLPEVAYKRLILSHNKQLNIGNYLIDDRLLNGAAAFNGEHIFFGQNNFPDWISVVNYIAEKENVKLTRYHFEKRETIILYFGGMHGSIESTTFNTLKNRINNIPVEYVDYDRKNPTVAKNEIEKEILKNIKYYKNIFLCGNSLGGYWANYFSEKYKIPCILINPSLVPKANLAKFGIEEKVLNKFKESTFEFKNKVALLGKNDDVVDNNFNAENLKEIEDIIWTDDGHRLSNYEALIKLINNKISKLK